ncbi:hypothetical protein I553_10452 [Mycobacterium xenopi 4042]|uniref:Uncharacterized protein n=1 Tax=Mycobacterium xenopi 4042 TaxID=1299334 RepID=X8E872_MYCXE|nr:hypothetical protein I553_10452 [Mycobacterium xenopi 4042]
MLTVPERGSADARDCLHVTDALSDEALIEARSRWTRPPVGWSVRCG